LKLATQARSPLTVTVLSYIPPLLSDRAGLPVDYDSLPLDQRFGINSAELLFEGSHPFGQAIHLPKFYHWSNEIWVPSCPFNAQDLWESVNYQEPVELNNLWDIVVYVLDKLPEIYAKLQDYIVEGVAYVITAGT